MAKLTLQDLANLQNESTAITTLKSNNDLIEIAMENTLSRDGLGPNHMLSDYDMNNYKIINLPDAISDQEPATYSQLQDAIGALSAGAVIQAPYVTVGNNGTLSNERALTAGTNLSLTDGGANNTVTLAVSDNELNALAATTAAADKLPYFNGVATATTTDFTSYARTLVDDADATTARATLGAVIGTNVQAWDADLDAVAGLSSSGLVARTGAGTAASRTLQAPAAGFTITNPAGTAGDPTFVLANDLAAVEGLSGTGLIAHTAANTMTERTITAPAAGITITNGGGVAGNPTLVLANDLAAYEGLAANGMVARTATDTAAVRTITGTANEITLTNGDGVSANPTVSIPTAVTFTGKTITGGTYSSPSLTTPSIGAATGTSLALTSSSANTLVVGLNGTTNPSFVVDDSIASQADGIKVQGQASGGGTAITAISPGSNSAISINPKGTSGLFIGNSQASPIINFAGSSGTSTLNVGQATVSGGSVVIAGATSGATTVNTQAAASGTFTLPTGGQMVGSSASAIWFDNIPQNTRNSAYTTTLTDAQKHIFHASADTTARTWTIDSNANVPYAIGTAITFVNQNAAGIITIAITTDTMRLAGSGATGSRTLAANGMATALKITSTEWIISGTGLT